MDINFFFFPENDEPEHAPRGWSSDLQCHFICSSSHCSQSAMPRYVIIIIIIEAQAN